MNNEFYHALAVEQDLCLGCAHCIRHCPTKALRIRNGKASLRKNWCVDCGECLKVCPVSAIYVEQDDFEAMLRYKCRVALFPAAFLGQFPEQYDTQELSAALGTLGFTHLLPAELTVSFVREQLTARIAANRRKPLISAFCPAVVRLIQTKFPDLVEHVTDIRPAVETSAMLIRRRLEQQGYAPSDIGIFYVTPCAARAATLRGGEEHLIDGMLNLNSLYNKVCHLLRNKKQHAGPPPHPAPRTSAADMTWSMTAGETAGVEGRSFAVDGIHNVVDFLERLETTGELHEIDFLELRACSRGCMGGALTPANRFLGEERARNRLAAYPAQAEAEAVVSADEREYLKARIHGAKPVRMTKLVYQGSIHEVLRQMNDAKQIEAQLPGIDCGACGSPTCRSLSNDIVRGEAVAENCVFMQCVRAQQGVIDAQQALRLLEEVWGRERFEKKSKP